MEFFSKIHNRVVMEFTDSFKCIIFKTKGCSNHQKNNFKRKIKIILITNPFVQFCRTVGMSNEDKGKAHLQPQKDLSKLPVQVHSKEQKIIQFS